MKRYVFPEILYACSLYFRCLHGSVYKMCLEMMRKKLITFIVPVSCKRSFLTECIKQIQFYYIYLFCCSHSILKSILMLITYQFLHKDDYLFFFNFALFKTYTHLLTSAKLYLNYFLIQCFPYFLTVIIFKYFVSVKIDF